MTACHAVAHCLLLGDFGFVRHPAAMAVTLPCLSPSVQLDMAPCFADDGILAGPSAQACREVSVTCVFPPLALVQQVWHRYGPSRDTNC